MTKHKTISSLSIAAIALVAAAVPALAQGQTELSGKNATPAVEQTIASNLESLAVRKSRITTPEVGLVKANNVSRTTKPLVLSSSAFKGQNNFTSAASSSRFANQVNFKDAGPANPQAKKQFRTDESEISKTKQVVFVPSRGQKLPE